MEYMDFELRVGPGDGRVYPLTVVRSPAGEAGATMTFPFDSLALENHLKGVEIAILRSGTTRRDLAAGEDRASVSDFGQRLFDALMTDTVRESFRRSQDRARAAGKGLRLRLRVEAPELAVLPWEFLYDASEGDFICLSTDTPLVRYLEFDRPPEALRVTPPLSILGVIASPSDLPALDVQRERQRLEVATSALSSSGLLKLTWVEGATWRDLQRELRHGPFHVLHFVGHGGFDRPTGEGVVVMADEDGRSAKLSATQLGRLLADHNSLRMVLLNSCLGAKGSGTDVFSSTASILIRRGVPAVVAMQYEISDRAAIEFARSLYEALADGVPIDAAVAEARKAISFGSGNSIEWGTPVLHMRSPDGVLFQIVGDTPSELRASGAFPDTAQTENAPPAAATARPAATPPPAIQPALSAPASAGARGRPAWLSSRRAGFGAVGAVAAVFLVTRLFGGGGEPFPVEEEPPLVEEGEATDGETVASLLSAEAPPVNGLTVNMVVYGNDTGEYLGTLWQRSDETWVEQEGSLTFHHTEVGHDDRSVSLDDPDRGQTISLDLAANEVIWEGPDGTRAAPILNATAGVNGWTATRIIALDEDDQPVLDWEQISTDTWVERSLPAEEVTDELHEDFRDDWSVYLSSGEVRLQLDLYTREAVYLQGGPETRLRIGGAR